MTETHSQSYPELVQQRTRRDLRKNRGAVARAAIEQANKRLVVEDYAAVADLIRSIADTLLDRNTERELREYAEEDAGGFHPSELVAVLQRGPRDREQVEDALSTLTVVAEAQAVIHSEYVSVADAVGFSGMKLGQNLQNAEMSRLGDPVGAISREAGTVKSMFSGPTGQGKSAAAERQFEDYYRLNFNDKWQCKCIDPADFSVAENIFYDVPQQQSDLQHVREEMDLPPSFKGIDGFTPNMEVFVPLTPSLDDEPLPYDTESEEFSVKPFVIPPTSISKGLFVKTIISRVSKGERDTIRSVYESVDRRNDDWTLEDMAEEVDSRDELSDKHRRRAIRTLKSLQDYGFIRQAPAYELDWSEIFTSTETVTVFNQSLCADEPTQLFVLAWLLDEMWTERRRSYSYPQLALALRELWEYAPHNQRENDGETAGELQDRIGYLLARFGRKNRDVRTHVVADTQHLMDIDISVREMFNRYVLMNGNNDVFENVFSWTGNDEWRSFKGTMSQRSGECGIVGLVEPAVQHDHIEYLSPVRMAPPSHHHHDKDEGMGWKVRCELVDNEELRTASDVDGAEWGSDIPSDLQFDLASIGSDVPKPERDPVAAFAFECLEEATVNEYALKSNVYDAFNQYLRANDLDRWDFDTRERTTQFGGRMNSEFDKIETVDREGEKAWKFLRLTRKGEELLDDARIEVQDAAAPILGDD